MTDDWSKEDIEEATPFSKTIPDKDCDHPEGSILWDRTAPTEGGEMFCKKCGGWL